MRDAIKQKLAAYKADFDRLGVKSLSVFGSVARGDESETSDLDVVVELNGPATLDAFMDLKDVVQTKLPALEAAVQTMLSRPAT